MNRRLALLAVAATAVLAATTLTGCWRDSQPKCEASAYVASLDRPGPGGGGGRGGRSGSRSTSRTKKSNTNHNPRPVVVHHDDDDDCD